MSDVAITKLTLDVLRESLQQVGYRVETATDPIAGVTYLRSATGGLGFDIRPGNQLPDSDGSFVDAAFTAVLQVQGELPLDLVNRWNATRRFGRLQLSQPFLVFCLDVSAAGGVMPDYLRAQIEIWDRLVQELIAYLRDELRQLSAKNGSVPAAAPAQNAPEAAASATMQ
jgi:Putative bacterial sensory transduction regulator